MRSYTVYRFHPSRWMCGLTLYHSHLEDVRSYTVLSSLKGYIIYIKGRIPRIQGMTKITSLNPGLKLIVFRLVNSGMTNTTFGFELSGLSHPV